MKVRIDWSPNPDLGVDEQGQPRHLTTELTDNFLIVWIDQFGVGQFTAKGFYDSYAIDEAVQDLPLPDKT